MTPPAWPTFNATLNACAGLLLVGGWFAVRSGRVQRHRLFMGSAFLVSAAFLVSYLLYHAQAGSVRYTGTGWLRTLYFSILLPHTVLAAVIVPFILRLLWLARKERFEDHKRLARWVWPSWVFVSASGVAVYLMLYVLPA